MIIGVWEMVGRLALAAALGALIGWEREAQGKPAGLRTIMLVSLASCIFVTGGAQADLSAGGNGDAMRAMAGIAQGIGFLGAGAILQARGEVRWLTTAAALWAAAAIGYVTGLGLYVLATVGSVLIYVILHWMVPIERRAMRSRKGGRRAEGKRRPASPGDSGELPPPPLD